MKRKIKLAEIPERRSPGETEAVRGSPGSIEQQLDMCETGDLRGDEIQFRHGMDYDEPYEGQDPLDLNEMLNNFSMDMSEPNREGNELSGDDHASGLQGESDAGNLSEEAEEAERFQQ